MYNIEILKTVDQEDVEIVTPLDGNGYLLPSLMKKVNCTFISIDK